jgi:hypothetical protein
MGNDAWFVVSVLGIGKDRASFAAVGASIFFFGLLFCLPLFDRQ